MGSLQAESEEKLEMDDSGCIQDETPPCKRFKGYQGVHLLDLSDDVLLLILRFLTPRDLKALGYTCPRLGALVLDRSLWVSVDARGQPWSRARLRWYLARALHAGTRELLLAGPRCQGDLNQSREDSTRLAGDKDCAKEDNNNTGDSEDSQSGEWDRSQSPRVIEVPALGPNAQLIIDELKDDSESWAYSDCLSDGDQYLLTAPALRQLADTCPALTSLALEYCNINCHTTSITQFPSTLKKLSLRGSNCYNLPLDRSFLFKIQDTMPGLESLDVSCCPWMEPASLLPLSKLPALRELCARDCLRLTEFVAYASLATRYGFTTLQSLDLRGSPVGDSEVSALGWLPRLARLWLSPATPRPQSPRSPGTQDDDAWEDMEPDYFKIKDLDCEPKTERCDGEENKHTWQASISKGLNGTATSFTSNQSSTPNSLVSSPSCTITTSKTAQSNNSSPTKSPSNQTSPNQSISSNPSPSEANSHKHTGQSNSPNQSQSQSNPPSQSNSSKPSSSQSRSSNQSIELSQSADQSNSSKPSSSQSRSSNSFSNQSIELGQSADQTNSSQQSPNQQSPQSTSPSQSIALSQSTDQTNSSQQSPSSTSPSQSIALNQSTDQTNSSQRSPSSTSPSQSIAVTQSTDQTNSSQRSPSSTSPSQSIALNQSADQTNSSQRSSSSTSPSQSIALNQSTDQSNSSQQSPSSTSSSQSMSPDRSRVFKRKPCTSPSPGPSKRRKDDSDTSDDDDDDAERCLEKDNESASTSRERRGQEGPAQNAEAQPRHHVLYVNVGQQVHAVYRLSLDNEHIVTFNLNPNVRRITSALPHHGGHIDAASLVTDSAIRRFGRADGEDINYVHIGHNGPAASQGARPDRSSLTHLTVTGFRHITDSSLNHLATAAPLLRFLDLRETNVTDKGVENFKSLRPECEVLYSKYVKKD